MIDVQDFIGLQQVHNQWGTTTSEGVEYKSMATLPIQFTTPFAAIGNIIDKVDAVSKANWDNSVKLTTTDIRFKLYGHKYIAIGLC